MDNCTSSFVSYLCRIFALFPHMESIFTNLWALVYRSPFIQHMTVLWTLRIYFQYIQLPKFCCLLGKELWNQLTRKSILCQQVSTTGLHTVLTVTSSWLGIWPFDCYLLQFPEFAIIIGTTFAVYFFKNTVLLLLLELLKENIDGTIAHQLYFLNIPLICSNCI